MIRKEILPINKFAVFRSASSSPRVFAAFVLGLVSLFFALLSFGAIRLSVVSIGGSDVDVITGGETSPHVTQNNSAVWGHGNTVVVAYKDSSGTTLTPSSACGISISTDGGKTFTRLPYKFNTGGSCFDYPAVFYSIRASKWFAGFQAGRCGGSGIGEWSSPDGINWSNLSCPFSSTQADLLSMWVDNNPGSPFFGRQYAFFNDFNLNGGSPRVAASTDDGITWAPPATLLSSFRRAWKVIGSPGTDGSVYAETLNENSGGVATPRQNFIQRSSDGGITWSAPTPQGPVFTGPGRSANGYFAGMYNTPLAGYWADMGWGDLGVGPNNTLHYAYSAAGAGGDPGDILYVRSTDTGLTWTAPAKLNTDATTRAQWSPSLSVNPQGRVFVSWYDERNTSDDSLQRFGRASLDNGATWGTEMPLSDVIFPKPLQPDANVNFTFVGLYNRPAFSDDGTGTVAYHAWTDGRVTIGGSPQQDIFFDRIPFTTCASFSENFSSVTPPALPASWAATNAQGPAPLWVTSATSPDTVPNDAFVDDPGATSDKRLDTPPILITTSGTQLSFRHNYTLESGFDGGVLEVSSPNINGGAFTDITNAAVGGSFASGGYNGTISPSFGSPIAARQAWTGTTGAYITTVANLGPNVVGHTITLRFRMASDASVGGTGWRIDTIAVTSTNCPPSLVSIVSRKTHTGAGDFDVNLPLSGPLGVECRKGLGVNSDIHQLVITFGTAVSVGGVSVTSSNGLATASTSVNGTSVVITLSSVANAQTLHVLLSNVSDGTTAGDLNIPMGVLFGDANGDGVVNSGDATVARNLSGQTASAANFRTDFNVDGTINSADATIARNNSGQTVGANPARRTVLSARSLPDPTE